MSVATQPCPVLVYLSKETLSTESGSGSASEERAGLSPAPSEQRVKRACVRSNESKGRFSENAVDVFAAQNVCRQTDGGFALSLVRMRGLEPPRPCGHWHLKPARLPIPPSGHEALELEPQRHIVND